MNQLKNLGSICLLLILPIFIYSEVFISIDKPNATKGEVVSVQIKAKGNDIEFPSIKTITSSQVVGTSSSTSTSIVNTSITTTKTQTYQFVATKSGDIGPFDIKIDGKVLQTKILHIYVSKPKPSTKRDDFFVLLKTSKTDLFVGEDMVVDIVFKYKEEKDVRRIQIQEFIQNNFVIKRLASAKPVNIGGYIVYKESYAVSPLKPGKWTIPSQKVSIGLNSLKADFFGLTQLKWQKIYSNTVDITVAALPQNVTIIGDLNITSFVDKTETTSNKPINLTVQIKGKGNLEDIDNINLDIKQVSVFSENPTIERETNTGTWTQKFSLISDNNYKIPKIKFKYFDKQTKEIKTINTKSFDIKIVGDTTQKPKLLQSAKTQKVKRQPSFDKYYFGFIGVIIGVMLMLVFIKFKQKITKRDIDISVEEMVKNTKTDKQLYMVLIKLKNAKLFDDTIEKLEQNIYKKQKNKIDKNKIIKKLQDKDDEYLYC